MDNDYTKEYIERELKTEVTDVSHISKQVTPNGNKYAVYDCNKGKGFICVHNKFLFGSGTWKGYIFGALHDSFVDDICTQVDSGKFL